MCKAAKPQTSNIYHSMKIKHQPSTKQLAENHTTAQVYTVGDLGSYLGDQTGQVLDSLMIHKPVWIYSFAECVWGLSFSVLKQWKKNSGLCNKVCSVKSEMNSRHQIVLLSFYSLLFPPSVTGDFFMWKAIYTPATSIWLLSTLKWD